MNNEEIADALKLTAQLMELHNENQFKVKSLLAASFRIDKLDRELEQVPFEELESIDGIGKSLASKIQELNTIGTTKELQALLEKTPIGVIEMLGIKGIGPKKVQLLWKQLELETVGELLYACNENRLVDLKGFGEKTQELVRKAIEYKLASNGFYHFAKAEIVALQLMDFLQKKYAPRHLSITGSLRRKCELVEKIEILTTVPSVDISEFINDAGIPIEIITCSEFEFTTRLFQTTGSVDHLAKLNFDSAVNYDSEEAIYKEHSFSFIEPELREGRNELELSSNKKLPRLIEPSDLKGILHNHSKYSDGQNTLKEMAVYAKELGYEYLGICDHSQSAFYASGMKEDKIVAQHQEIEQLNKELYPFKIFKGVESDILNDGNLDYPEEILKSFDFIVASVHSNLKMNEEKATARLIKAIENPYTTILGHPTGRLLLSREGYPIDHKKIIDACAANGIIMELNAHPYRLDIDWRWIPYCLEKGVKISINPDAHKTSGYHDMYYGCCVARKGMLSKEMCFNAHSRAEIEAHFLARKK
ncbi:MAG TPA: PHP domain-containing protein [Bacteroidia bacterium]|nr:PHP domain-containing protein [Bacteroidia bacterium]HRH09648.1 PHP domain-containing protein [Bacteroidia bacterium]